MSNFSIFVALPEELRSVLDILGENGEFITPPSQFEAGQRRFKYHLDAKTEDKPAIEGEIFLIRGMGNVKSAAFVGACVATGKAPTNAVLVGISGSLDRDKLRVGDVIMSGHVKFYSPDKIHSLPDSEYVLISEDDAEKICDPEDPLQLEDLGHTKSCKVDSRDIRMKNNYYRYVREKIFNDSEAGEISEYIHENSKAILPALNMVDGPPRIVEGAILGSNIVIDSQAFVDYILSKNTCDDLDFYSMNSPSEYAERCSWDSTELLAVDMESYGFFSAFNDLSYFSTSVKPIAIRGISDLAAGKAEADQESNGVNREKAAANAMTVALDYIRRQSKTATFST